MKASVSLLCVAAILAGCSGNGFRLGSRPSEPAVAVTVDPDDTVLRPQTRPDGSGPLDGQLPQTGEAAPEPQSNGYLGETLAGLGAPTEAGRWLVTGLVTQVQDGHVEAEDGTRVTLELRPSGAAPSAGSQISLQAMQALGLSLAGLSTLKVYVD